MTSAPPPSEILYLIQRKLELSSLIGGGETVIIIDSKHQSLVEGITEKNWIFQKIHFMRRLNCVSDKFNRSNLV